MKENNKPFSSNWWLEMSKRADYRANNYAWQSFYFDVAEYCKDRALTSVPKPKSENLDW